MANPFKEAEKAKKKAPGSARVEPEIEVKVTAPVEEKKQEEPVKPVAEEKPVEEVAEKNKPVSDLFAGLKSNEKPAAKTHAFYLSDENVDKLKKMAKKKGVSTSKLLDHILSEIL